MFTHAPMIQRKQNSMHFPGSIFICPQRILTNFGFYELGFLYFKFIIIILYTVQASNNFKYITINNNKKYPFPFLS